MSSHIPGAIACIILGVALTRQITGAQQQETQRAPRFAIRDLGLLANPTVGVGPGIDASGHVAAWAPTGVGFTAGLSAHAHLWDGDKETDLGSLAGYPNSYALAVNPRGQVVGLARAQKDTRLCRAFLWESGRIHDLGTLGGSYGVANAISAEGRAVGGAALAGGKIHACLWQGNAARDLGLLPGGDYSLAHGVNRKGQVVGVADVAANGSNHACLWQDGRIQDLGLAPGGRFADARAINDQGEVVGWAGTAQGETHAFLWAQGKMQDLGTLGDDPAAAWSINNRGQIVGNASTTRQRMHACLWQDEHVYDLNDLIPAGSGWTLQYASGINDQGQIVGTGQMKGLPHLFLLTPLDAAARAAQGSETVRAVPAPSALPAMGQTAPEFHLTDGDGQKRSLTDFSGHPIVLYFFCGCDRCRRCAQEWSRVQAAGALQQGTAPGAPAPITLVVFMGDADAARDFLTSTGMDARRTTLLPDPLLAVSTAYSATPCPRVLVLNGHRRVRYVNNGHDDDPLSASAIVIVSKAVSALRRTAPSVSRNDAGRQERDHEDR